MSQTILGDISVVWNHTYVNALDLNNVTDKLAKTVKKSFTNGSGANKAQAVWTDSRSLLTTTSETLDLNALVNAFGTLSLSKVKAIMIYPTTATAGYRLLVSAGASNGWSACFGDASDVLRVDAGSPALLTSFVDGWTVDGTHKTIKIENPSGGTVAYEILILGEGTVA